MIEMPIVGNAIVGAVLAHRRNDDPVRQLKLREPQGRKQGTGHATRTDWNVGRKIRNCPPDRQAGFGASLASGNRAAAGLLARRLPLGRWGKRCPALAFPHRFPQAREKPFFAVILLPSSAAIELDEMRSPPLSKRAPFLCGLINERRGKPWRHENAETGLELRCEIVPSQGCTDNFEL